MTELTIMPTDGILNYYPGEQMTGQVGWTVDEPVQSAELRLFWHTSGRGRRDIRIVQTIPFAQPMPRDHRPFSLTLPASPYSFRGNLITLTWSLELVLNAGQHSRLLDLVISPTAEEIALVRST